MTEASNNAVRPIKLFLFLVPVAMGAAWYAGTEIGNGEVSQYRAATLEQNTAKFKVLRVKRDVPPGVVISGDLVDVQDAFANRVEADMVTKLEDVLNKKTKYGLCAGQVVVKNDVE